LLEVVGLLDHLSQLGTVLRVGQSKFKLVVCMALKGFIETECNRDENTVDVGHRGKQLGRR
jgi:hypothetical protein